MVDLALLETYHRRFIVGFSATGSRQQNEHRNPYDRGRMAPLQCKIIKIKTGKQLPYHETQSWIYAVLVCSVIGFSFFSLSFIVLIESLFINIIVSFGLRFSNVC